MSKKNLLKRKKKQQPEDSSGRITNETVAEHREKILAGGRRFKYPHQYLKHKLVINAIILTIVLLIAIIVLGWVQLYKAQNTSNFMYRVTRVLPLPVAKVDDVSVRYSDYLMRYRSQELWLRNNGQLGLNPNDERQQLNFFKRSVLDGLEKDAYAQKLADENDITVTNEEIDEVLEESRTTATGMISEEVYNASTLDTLGYSPDEYRHIIRQALVRQKVSYHIDKTAFDTQSKVAKALSKTRGDNRLQKVVDKLKAQDLDIEYGESGLVPKNNRDGGLTQAALKLKDGEVSDVIKSTNGTGYYFVQRLSSSTNRISYQSLRIPLTEFDTKFQQIKDNNKIEEYIKLEEQEA